MATYPEFRALSTLRARSGISAGMFFAKKKPQLDGLPVWMDPTEFATLVAAVHAVGPTSFLEWGVGGSTRALLAAFPTIERYLAVEHNPAWVEQVRSVVADPRLSLQLVLPDTPPPPGGGPRRAAGQPAQESPAFDDRAEYDRSLMKTYIETPRRLGFRPDFVLVDGRARRFCLMEAFDLVRPGGVVALHDAQREEYHGVLRDLGAPRFLEPWTQGQIALLRKA